MGDQSTILDTASARHLLRRTLLGAGPGSLDRFNIVPGVTTRGQAVDILQVARASTGWRHDGRNAYLDTSEHDFTADYPARGPKAVFDGAHGFPPGGADFSLAFRLLEYFAYANPSKATLDQVVSESGFDVDFR